MWHVWSQFPDQGPSPHSLQWKCGFLTTRSPGIVLVAQSRLTLCNPTDCNPPGSSVHRILQARILEWLPFPPPGDLPDRAIKPWPAALQADSSPSEPPGKDHQRSPQTAPTLNRCSGFVILAGLSTEMQVHQGAIWAGLPRPPLPPGSLSSPPVLTPGLFPPSLTSPRGYISTLTFYFFFLICFECVCNHSLKHFYDRGSKIVIT